MSASDHLSPQQFFHGSHKKFKPGDVLLPPSRTGEEARSHPDIDPSEFNNREHVYMTDSPESAASYASDKGGTHVYEVEPHKDVHEDPESAVTGETGTYRASKAVVKRRVRVKPTSPTK